MLVYRVKEGFSEIMYLRHIGFLVLFVVFSQFSLIGQTRVGLASTSWTGVADLNFNPAVANNMHLWDISLGSMTIYYGSNHYKAQIGRVFNSFGAGLLSPDFITREFFKAGDPQTENGDNIAIDRYSHVQGPGSFIVPLGKNKPNEGKRKRAVLGFSWNFNNILNVREGDKTLLDQYTFGAANSPTVYEGRTISAKSHAWMDYGITYSQVLVDKRKHLFKGGLTMKLIHGQGFVSLEADDVSFLQSGPDMLFTAPDGSVRSSNGMIYNADEEFAIMNGVANLSVGSDIGFVYEFRPKRDKYRYTMDNNDSLLRPDAAHHTLAIGMSVMDLGNASYSAANDITLQGNAYLLPFSQQDSGIYKINENLRNQGAFDNFGSAKAKLPTRVNLFVDINTGAKGLGFNLSATISPQITNGTNGARYPNSFTLTPRIEHRWFGLFLPLSVTENSGFAFGTAARIGPISIGVSNIISMFNNKNSNTTFYIGARIFIPERKAKDKDKDKVSDKYDQCIDQPGNWYSKGCPDRDNDGVPDKFDECPDAMGPSLTAGCPDTDRDGVLDKDDDCPNEAGLPQFNGCPDKDGDGIMDKDDKCPDVPQGPNGFEGCPDTDGDGIVDHLDDCPNEPQGTNGRNGCPDTDGDGVIDKYDLCIELPGLPENEGCPDSDGDGFFDHQDDCPYLPGPEEHNGCPDTDGDGVRDRDDDCPYEKGPPENGGCPFADGSSGKTEETGEVSLAGRVEGLVENIDFLPADYAFTKEPSTKKIEVRKIQDFVAALEPNSIIIVQGHTGGKAAEGGVHDWDKLSADRANTVLELLIEAGVERSRIKVEHYGNTMPLIVSSDWKKDKLNRRVTLIEMK